MIDDSKRELRLLIHEQFRPPGMEPVEYA